MSQILPAQPANLADVEATRNHFLNCIATLTNEENYLSKELNDTITLLSTKNSELLHVKKQIVALQNSLLQLSQLEATLKEQETQQGEPATIIPAA